MEIYQDIIENKYKLSNKYFNTILEKNNNIPEESVYLYFFDILNVYPLFPTIINFKLNSSSMKVDTNVINLDYNNKPKYNTKIKDLIKQLNEKINLLNFTEQELTSRQRGMVRKFFSYEIIDKLKLEYNAEYVTTAWLKCYEIIKTYNLINANTKSSSISYFGICEQPGAFIYAINHYVRVELDKKFEFIIQSLVDNTNKKIFKPDPKLFSQYKNNYDYGSDSTGDVTKVENIRYYRKKYYNTHFDIITADCGLDCSSEPINQEKDMSIVVLGQAILALSLCDTNTNYFFKLFTIFENITKEILWLITQFFESVELCRTLTTKPESGEIYCVCKNFKYSKVLTNQVLESMYSWYDIFKNNKTISLVSPGLINNSFIENIDNISKVLIWRRITSINWLYFRFKNNSYAQSRKKIYDYVNSLVDHYVEYYIKIYNIKKLPNNMKLVN